MTIFSLCNQESIYNVNLRKIAVDTWEREYSFYLHMITNEAAPDLCMIDVFFI